jgi:hypothetical protein
MTRAAAWAVRAGAVGAVLALGTTVLTGCGGSPASLGPAGVDELTIPTPSPDPSDFPPGSENAWFPLAHGTTWTYRQFTIAGNRLVRAAVLPAGPRVDGVTTTAVRWQVRTGAGLRTVLDRWYAVDRAGNVWWFGQRVYRAGSRIDALAPLSWRAGRHGAEAGLILTATPRAGDGYANARQARVVARRSTVATLDGTVATTTRTFRHTVVTRDLSSLAPLHTVQTFYARGLGMVAQQDTTVTSVSLSLVRVHRG